MALFLANTTIYHPGRTAGHWVRKSLALLNLIVDTTQAVHDSPPRIQHLPEVKAREHSVSFVRHPADWIRSLWIHESQYGWTMDELKPSHGLASFEEYLEEIIDRYPVGAAQHYFSPFLDAVSVNLRTETLAETLLPTLAQFGEPLLAEVAVAPALNRSPCSAPGSLDTSLFRLRRPGLGCDGLLKVLSPGLSRRSVPQFLDQPLLVVLLDELPHRGPYFFNVLKNSSIDGLFFQGAIEPLCDSVGLRLTDKRKTGIYAPILDLVQEVVR